MRSRKEIESDISEEFLSGKIEVSECPVIKNIELELLLDIRDKLTLLTGSEEEGK